jgi:hypothetical protein
VLPRQSVAVDASPHPWRVCLHCLAIGANAGRHTATSTDQGDDEGATQDEVDKRVSPRSNSSATNRHDLRPAPRSISVRKRQFDNNFRRSHASKLPTPFNRLDNCL